MFSLFLLAISEASLYFVDSLFAVIGRLGSFLSAVLEAFCCFCRPSWNLLAVFVSHLGSFSLFSSAILEASVCRSCCFVVGHFLAALASRSCCFLLFLVVLLAVLMACHSHSFLVKTFSGFPFLIGALVSIQ